MQSAQPVVEIWQLVGSVSGVVVVVLAAYGALILKNRIRVNRIHQRLLGAEGDVSDTGFIRETRRRLDGLERIQQQHARQTHTQLYKLDRKMDVVLDAVADGDGVDVPRVVEDMDDVPPPPSDFYHGGSSPSESGSTWSSDGDD